jgi:hypothetical protein
MACAICGVRKPRRYCPGVRGDICTICCGTQRERTVNCPLECEYLQEARIREKPPLLSGDDLPNKDIRVTDEFLRKHEPLLVVLAATVMNAALEYDGTVDYDVREALDAQIRTYRTMQSGLVYESRPANPMAGHVYGRIQESVENLRRKLQESTGMSSIRDKDVLGILVFLHRMELQHNNGREKGRAFIDFLRQYFPQKPVEASLLA